MRPTEGPSSSVFEVEISPSEFFQDLGVMVIEGRVPELTASGRRTGIHSWPLTNNSKKSCCFKTNIQEELCLLVENTRSKILSFLPTQSIVIDVFGSPEPLEDIDMHNKKQNRIYIDKAKKPNMILLEKWKITIKEKRESSTYVNVNMVLQAVRSYLHFSQLSAWWNSSCGRFPSQIYYRISHDSKEEFLTNSNLHYFPWTEISKSQSMQITVYSLPRMEIMDLSFILNQEKNLLTLSESQHLNNQWNSKFKTSKKIMGNNLVSSSLKKESNMNQNPTVLCDGRFGKRKDDEIDKYFSNHLRSSNCQTTSYVGEKIIKLDKKYEDSVNPGKTAPSKLISNQEEKAESLSALLEKQRTVNQDVKDLNNGLEDLLQNFILNEPDTIDDFSDDEDEDGASDSNTCKNVLQQFSIEDTTPPRNVKNDMVDNNFKTCPRLRCKSASPNFIFKKQADTKASLESKPVAARRLAMVSGTVPIFNAKTGLPMSSSPAPIKRPRKISEASFENSLSRSGSYDDLKPTCSGLSKSAPPTTGLLGNFEESVLKGRIPVNGTLEGFRAELSASGSFCGKHVIIPVKVHYFHLSDDNAPSPYLGHISLRKLKKKKYHVPKKGTIQLTIFNPNGMVVKVFVVLYNFEDMPARSKTFLRQRMISVREDPKTMADVQFTHYLVHLSFVASKHSHIYLHTDIRIIFPQQTPDRPLLTVTESPTDPKYTPLLHIHHKCDDEN